MNTIPKHIIDYCNAQADQRAQYFREQVKIFKLVVSQDNMLYYLVCEHEWEVQPHLSLDNYACTDCGMHLLYEP